MRNILPFIALGAVVASAPAAAQLGIGLGGQSGLNVGVGVGVDAGAGVDTGGVVGAATDTLGRTVGTVDRTANGLLRSELRLATAADLGAGATVSDNRGRRLGVLQSVQGDTAIVVRNNRALHVPLAQLYRGSAGLVTRLSRAQLEAHTAAHASAHGSAHGSVRN